MLTYNWYVNTNSVSINNGSVPVWVNIHDAIKHNKNVIINNPYIDKLFTFKNDVSELFEELKSENYDVII